MCRHGAHDVGRQFALTKDSMPDFKVDEEPETIAVWSPARAMLVDETLQRRAVEETPRLRPPAEHELVDDRTEFIAQPAADGNRKPHLRPRQD